MSKMKDYEQSNKDYVSEIFDDSNLSLQRQNIKQTFISYFYFTFKTISLIMLPIIVSVVVLVILVFIRKNENSKNSVPVRNECKKLKNHKSSRKHEKNKCNPLYKKKESVIPLENVSGSEYFECTCGVLPNSEHNQKTASNKMTGFKEIEEDKINRNFTKSIESLSNNQKITVISLKEENDLDYFKSSFEIFPVTVPNDKRESNESTGCNFNEVANIKIKAKSASNFKNLSNNQKETIIELKDNNDDFEYFDSSCEILTETQHNSRRESNKLSKSDLKDSKYHAINKTFTENHSNNQKEIIHFSENFKQFETLSGILPALEQNEEISDETLRHHKKFSKLKSHSELQDISKKSVILDKNGSSFRSHFAANLNSSEEEKIREIKNLQNPYDLDESVAVKFPVSSYDSDSLYGYMLSPRDWLGNNYEKNNSDDCTLSETLLIYGKKRASLAVSLCNENLFHST